MSAHASCYTFCVLRPLTNSKFDVKKTASGKRLQVIFNDKELQPFATMHCQIVNINGKHLPPFNFSGLSLRRHGLIGTMERYYNYVAYSSHLEALGKCCPRWVLRARLAKPHFHFARLMGSREDPENRQRCILNCLVS